MNIKQMEKIRQRAHEAFISFEGVLGVGYGLKRVKGKDTSTTAVVIFVEKKLPREKVKKGELIPKTFADFPTDVEEVRFDSHRDEKDDSGHHEGRPMAQFLDWGKIHRLNLEQKRRAGGTTERSRKPRGGEKNPPPGDNPPVTETRGNLFIVEDHGTLTYTYTDSNNVQQQAIDLVGCWQLFRAQFGDDYDFAVFFLDDTDPNFPDMGNFSDAIFHAASENGFGVGAKNDRATWNNSNRLLRYVCHSWYSLRTMLHEVGHQWLFFVNYRNSANGVEQTLLHESWSANWNAGQKPYHPGLWADNDRSCMDYDHDDWIEISPGVYSSIGVAADGDFNFCPLDQYLMGFANPEIVASSRADPPTYPASGGDFQIINNPVQQPNGNYTSTPVTITAQNIIWNEGARTPSHLTSQRVFHEAVIAVTYNRTQFAQFLADSETRRGSQPQNWRRATSGRSVIDTSLLRTNINDLYIRDNTSDTGGAFLGGDFWNSPDIFVRVQDDDPNLYLSPSIANDTIHEKPKSNQDNWIYARISNKAATAYDNVTVNFYLANFKGFSGRDTAAQAVPRTEVIYPLDWHPDSLIGSASLATVPAGGTAVAKVKWPQAMIPPEADWHPCLLVDVIPLGTSPTALHNVWDNKKLAQKNIEIEYVTSDQYEFDIPFVIGHLESISPYAVVEIAKELDLPDLRILLDPGESLVNLQEIGGKLYHQIAGLEAIGAEKVSESRGVVAQAPDRPGLILDIPRNTSVGLGCGHDVEDGKDIVQVTFCDDTRLLVKAPDVDYRRLGFLPLTGLKLEYHENRPLLRMIDSKQARFPVSLAKVKAHEMRLKLRVEGKKLERAVSMHIVQRDDKGKIVGGIEVQLRPGR